MNQTQENQSSEGAEAPSAHVPGRTVTDHFHELFLKAYGRKPAWPQSLIQQARRLAEARPWTDIRAAMELYFADNGLWFMKGGRSFASFLAHYDELLSNLPKQKSEVEKGQDEALREALRA